jgi:hypothetical protein
MSVPELSKVDYWLAEGFVQSTGIEELPAVVEKPEERFDIDRYEKVMRAAANTYRLILDGRGVLHEYIIFNEGQLVNGNVLTNDTNSSGVVQNPGKMQEVGIRATLDPYTAHSYMGTFGVYPNGPLSKNDFRQLSWFGRYSYGLGTEDDPYRPFDSYLYVKQMYEDNEIPLPTHIYGDADGGNQGLGFTLAVGGIKGIVLNSPRGIKGVNKAIRIDAYQDIASRWNRMVSSEDMGITGDNLERVKQLMRPQVYNDQNWNDHKAPWPVVHHPGEWIKAGLVMYRGLLRQKNADLDNLNRHAFFHNLRAAMEATDAEVTMQFGSKDKLNPVPNILQFTEVFMANYRPQLWTLNNKLSVIFQEDAGHDAHTDKPLVIPEILNRIHFPNIRRMLSVVNGGQVMVETALDNQSTDRAVV